MRSTAGVRPPVRRDDRRQSNGSLDATQDLRPVAQQPEPPGEVRDDRGLVFERPGVDPGNGRQRADQVGDAARIVSGRDPGRGRDGGEVAVAVQVAGYGVEANPAERTRSRPDTRADDEQIHHPGSRSSARRGAAGRACRPPPSRRIYLSSLISVAVRTFLPSSSSTVPVAVVLTVLVQTVLW